jgi:hypothetical protein
MVMEDGDGQHCVGGDPARPLNHRGKCCLTEVGMLRVIGGATVSAPTVSACSNRTPANDGPRVAPKPHQEPHGDQPNSPCRHCRCSTSVIAVGYPNAPAARLAVPAVLKHDAEGWTVMVGAGLMSGRPVDGEQRGHGDVPRRPKLRCGRASTRRLADHPHRWEWDGPAR